MQNVQGQAVIALNIPRLGIRVKVQCFCFGLDSGLLRAACWPIWEFEEVAVPNHSRSKPVLADVQGQAHNRRIEQPANGGSVLPQSCAQFVGARTTIMSLDALGCCRSSLLHRSCQAQEQMASSPL